jgi:hypothetical protein
VDVPPVDNHQNVLVALGGADGKATGKVSRGPLVLVKGDGGAGEGNVGEQRCVDGQQGEASGRGDSAGGRDTLTQGVKVAVGGRIFGQGRE